MKGVIVVAKHHDGFCLWPCELTDYNITQSAYDGPKNRDGKTDLIMEVRKACDKYGLQMGLYLSPWDRNYADYGKPEYVDYYYKQLEQILTRYGRLFEVWFDGANGGDGYYGGARESRTIDRRNYYNFPKINEMVRKWHPEAIIFSDGGPGCRWVGNERGFASATNWAFLRSKEVYPGYPKYRELQYGHADGDAWIPSECDVSIRPGWFYHPEEDERVKTPEQLADIYYRSVGHNGTFLLNFPVNREGRIHPTDSLNAVRFREIIDRELGTNLLRHVPASVSSCRGEKFSSTMRTDGDWDSYWATPDGVTTGEVEFRLKAPTRINRLMLQEYIPLGQRVKQFSVQALVGRKWQDIDCGEETTTVGYKRILRFRTVEAEGLRIRFEDARGPLCINNIAAFYGGPESERTAAEASGGEFASVKFDIVRQDKGSVMLDLGAERAVRAFHYLPDQGESPKGLVHQYELWTCDAAGTPLQLLKSGEFSNIRNNPILQSLRFAPTPARYLLLKAVKLVEKGEALGFEKLGVEDI